jgi:hypothetical protein
MDIKANVINIASVDGYLVPNEIPVHKMNITGWRRAA